MRNWNAMRIIFPKNTEPRCDLLLALPPTCRTGKWENRYVLRNPCFYTLANLKVELSPLALSLAKFFQCFLLDNIFLQIAKGNVKFIYTQISG